MMANKGTKRIAIFLSVVLCLGLLAGCQNVNNLLGGSGVGTNITVVSNEISFPIEKIRTLNPIISKDEDAYFMNQLIYQGLFELNADLKPMPALARQAELAADGVTLTVELQKNIRWSDGEPFTASDVKYSIDAYRNAAEEEESTLYASYIQTISSCKAEDSDTVIITFQNKESAALENLTFPIVSAKQFRGMNAGAKQSGKVFVPVGTGPYTVVSMNADKEIILEGNPNYNGKQPENRLIFKVFPDKGTAVNLFEVGAVDFMVLRGPDRDVLLQDKPVNETSFLSNEVEFLGFNAEAPVLQDKRVRQAIAFAVDADSILEECYYGNGVRNETIYPPGYLGFPKEEDHYPLNIKKARSLMREVGYTDGDGDGSLEIGGGSPLTMHLLVNAEDVFRNLAAQMIQANLGKLGISVIIDSLTWEAYSLALAEGGYDMYLGGFQARDAYGMNSILKSGSGNPKDFTSEKLDAMLDRLTVTVGTEEKIAAFDGVRKILLDEVPQYCLFYKTYGIVSASSLEGEIQSTYFNVYKGCETFVINRRPQAE